MRKFIVGSFALCLLGGAAIAQSGSAPSAAPSTSGSVDAGAGAAAQRGACSHHSDPDERTRCLNNLQLQGRGAAAGGIGGTGATGSGAVSGDAGVGGRALEGGASGGVGAAGGTATRR